MAFIRTKRIKKKSGAIYEYLYIVENKRSRGKRMKQKMKKYLGRVYRHSRDNVMDFYEFYEIEDVNRYIDENSKDDIIWDLIKLELFNHGFEEEKDVFSKDGCFVNLKDRKVYNERGNSVAFAFNEGFLTTHAIRKILNFRAEDEEDGYDFAKMFVEAGISIPQDVFVGVFRKVFK